MTKGMAAYWGMILRKNNVTNMTIVKKVILISELPKFREVPIKWYDFAQKSENIQTLI
jgi:hypothetical protein